MTDFENILTKIDTIKTENYKKFNIIINNIKAEAPNNKLSFKVRELKNTIRYQNIILPKYNL